MFSKPNVYLLTALLSLVHSYQSSPADFNATHVTVPKKESRTILHPRAVKSKKMITTCKQPGTFAITFDDGPYIYENTVSDYLSARGMHGTFFVNGYNYDCIYDQEIVDQLKHTFSQGHLIGSHTWSHPDITKLTPDELELQLDLVETAMKKILGVIPRYFRPPYGNINDQNLEVLNRRGYKVIAWSFDSGDSIGVSATASDRAYDKIAKSFPTPQIALNHETQAATASIVSKHAVGVLQKAGYRLVSVSECLGSGNKLRDYYQYVGKPQKRDSSWTCAGTPKPSS